MAQDKGWPGDQLEVMSLPYIEVYWSCSEPAHSSYTRAHKTTTRNCTQERSRVLEGGMTDYAWQWRGGNLLANCQPRQLSLYCFVMAAYYWSLMYTEGVRLDRPPHVGSTIYLRGGEGGQVMRTFRPEVTRTDREETSTNGGAAWQFHSTCIWGEWRHSIGEEMDWLCHWLCDHPQICPIRTQI